MRLLYQTGMIVYSALLVIASFFVKKASLLVKGRRNSIKRLKAYRNASEKNSKCIWFHFASLGEFEQGRPVLEHFRSHHPNFKYYITFYSPSGHEIRHNTHLADEVFYLPSDSPAHAKLVLDAFNPEIAVFTKYEYWYFYFKECQQRNIPMYMVSAIFRPKQIYFKPYGKFFRSILSLVHYFFVQNESSLLLLRSLGIDGALLAGDTRFDRVLNLPVSPSDQTNWIHSFSSGSLTLVAGSTWYPDEKHIANVLSDFTDWKLIIAPHEIGPNRIQEVKDLFANSILLSDVIKTDTEHVNIFEQKQVLIIDSIGLLSQLYRYGSVAYIGGGFGAGIHNTLEAATYGIPLVFGPAYQKFQEAIDLISLDAATSFSKTKELSDWISKMTDSEQRVQSGEMARKYVERSAGATIKIISKIEADLLIGQK